MGETGDIGEGAGQQRSAMGSQPSLKALSLRRAFEDLEDLEEIPAPQPPAAPPAPPPMATARHTTSLRKRFTDFEELEAVPPPPPPPPPPPQPVAPPLPELRGKRIGTILVALGMLTEGRIRAVADETQLTKEPLGKCLVRNKLITPEQLCVALSYQSGLPAVDLSPLQSISSAYDRLRPAIRRYEAVPFGESNGALQVAVKRPPSPQRTEQIEDAFGQQLSFYLAPDGQIEALLAPLIAAQREEKRQYRRYRMLMPVWLEPCGERRAGSLPKQGGKILDISLGGMRVDAPDQLMPCLKTHPGVLPLIHVQFGTAPLEVHGVCVVRHVRKKETTRLWENAWILGLEFKKVGAVEAGHLKEVIGRAEVAAQRLAVEFGPDAQF
jgi:hypothetical protein